ncbi:FAD-binding oxidoreductase [bacterium]|nr:MAG: FAD-binding oxidoreductase [bacterium]
MTTGMIFDLKGEAMGLRETIGGEVFLPEDAGYEEARLCWNRVVDQHPALIVDAASVGDVQAAIRFAHRNDLKVAVMATGHGMARGCDGGLLLLIRRMNTVTVDVAGRTAWIGGGAKFEDLLPASQAAGLAPLSGSAPHIGVVGYTLGGGYGLLLRQYGLAVDSVRSAQIVTADGEAIRVSATEHADLFWAILGGGGAFGVIVEIEMELYPAATVYGGATIYPADDAESILNAYAAWTATLPDSVSSCIQVMNLPPAPFIPEPLRGRAVVNVNACVCGDLEGAEEWVRPMRELGPSFVDMWGTFPYAESAQIYNDPRDPMPALGRGVLLSDLNPETVANLMETHGPIPQSPLLSIQIRHLGGAMARVPHEKTAIGCRRDAKYLIYMLGVPHPMATPEAILGKQSAIFEAISGHTMCPGPLNFLGEGMVKAEEIRALFDDPDFERLQSVKRSYDPHNRFPFASLGFCE